jgi:integrase/recombinase XerD
LKLRKHTNDIQNTTYEVEAMSKQAKTLTAEELRRVLDYTATRKHSVRNRALVLTFYSGCRVGEISSLLYTDVVDAEGNVRSEVVLRAENTKTKEARTVFVNAKLKKELQSYISGYKPTNTKCQTVLQSKVKQ